MKTLVSNTLKIFNLTLIIFSVLPQSYASDITDASNEKKGCWIKAKEYGPSGANQKQKMSHLQTDGSFLDYTREECLDAGNRYADAIVAWGDQKIKVLKNKIIVRKWNTQYNIVKVIYNGEIIDLHENDDVAHTDIKEYEYKVKSGFKCWMSQNCFDELERR